MIIQKIKKNSVFAALALLVALFTAGCASGPVSNPELISKFKPHLSIAPDETLVYVFRQKTMAGAALPIYVNLDTACVSDLDQGTYTYFKLGPGVHTVSVEQDYPLKSIAVDNRKGETVFLYFKYERAEFEELPSDIGKTMVMTYKEAKPFNEKYESRALSDSLMNPSLVGLYLMKPRVEPLKPDADYAVVTFMRTKNVVSNRTIAVWSGTEFLGNLAGKTYFQAKVPAGQHLFYSSIDMSDEEKVKSLENITKRTGKKAWLPVDLAAGKEYFVYLDVGYGDFGSAVQFKTIKNDVKSETLTKLLASLSPFVRDDAAITDAVRVRLDAAKPELEAAMPQVIVKGLFEKGAALTPADGRDSL